MDELRSRLFYEQKNGYDLIGTEERIDAEKYCRAYMRYLNSSRTEREAVENAIRLAEKMALSNMCPGWNFTAATESIETTEARR